MKHIQLFENFFENPIMEVRTVPESSYSVIPVYKYTKSGSIGSPEENITNSEVIPKLQILLELQRAGKIKEVHVTADVPTQGRRTPKYIKDIIRDEKIRMAKKHYYETGEEIDPDSDDFDFDIDRFGDQRTIFFDSQFIVKRIEKIGAEEYIIGTPYSKQKQGFQVRISPMKVDEIFYQPL